MHKGLDDAIKRKVAPCDIALVHCILLFVALMHLAIMACLMTKTERN